MATGRPAKGLPPPSRWEMMGPRRSGGHGGEQRRWNWERCCGRTVKWRRWCGDGRNQGCCTVWGLRRFEELGICHLQRWGDRKRKQVWGGGTKLHLRNDRRGLPGRAESERIFQCFSHLNMQMNVMHYSVLKLEILHFQPAFIWCCRSRSHISSRKDSEYSPEPQIYFRGHHPRADQKLQESIIMNRDRTGEEGTKYKIQTPEKTNKISFIEKLYCSASSVRSSGHVTCPI